MSRTPTLSAPHARRPAVPRDQAHGLRQMFAGAQLRFVPLVHNPQVPGAGAVMERLCSAFAERGLRTLVVDAADTASPPHELASVDLSACIETLSNSVSYLAARGLPMDYLDNRATQVGFLEALRAAAVHIDVVLLHAGALDLRRMFVGRAPRPVLLASPRQDSLTHAYSSMKLLSQRLGALAYDLVITDEPGSRTARRMAERLADCADHFLGAALRDVAVLDPHASARSAVSADLRHLAAGLVADASAELVADPLAPDPDARGEVSPSAVLQAPRRRPLAAGRMN